MKKSLFTIPVCMLIAGNLMAQLTGSLQLTTSVTPSSTCSAPCDGTASVKASGGTAPYTYNWSSSPAQTTATATGLCPGTYTVLVNDATPAIPNFGTATVTITCNGTVGGALTATATASPANACTAPCDGAGFVTASGGVPPYTYIWSTIPGQSTQGATGLCPGTYTVVVRDANTPQPNMVSSTVTVTCNGINPGTLQLTTSVTPASACTAPCNGTAFVGASGGTLPYTYVWGTTPVQTTQTATGLCPGSYSVTVFDASSPNPKQAKTSVTIVCSTPNGIASISDEQMISIFPNPAQNVLTVQMDPSMQGVVRVSIVGVLGNVMYSGVVDATAAHTFNIADLPTGIYTILFSTNEAVITRQFIKE